jgi:anti-sigma factor ChrR (cupin superfamily)
MMNEHVTHEQIRRFRAGTLPPGESRGVGNHIASCADCRRVAQSDPSLRQTAGRLAQALGALDDEHPDGQSIAAFAGNRLPADQRTAIEEHLEECDRCREDVDDLQTIAPALPAPVPWSRRYRPRPRRSALVFAAAVAAVLAILFFVSSPRRESRAIPEVRTTIPGPLSTGPEPRARPAPAWPSGVRSAIESGELHPPPRFLALQQPADIVRGDDSHSQAEVRLNTPVDEVVETPHPWFRWEPKAGTRFVVVVAERGREVIRSPELTHDSGWQPLTGLTPGHSYEWQLEVTRDGVTTAVPVPPQPPVRFSVLPEQEAASLAAARAANPADHLLLGVLAAQSGLRREAEAELRLAAESPATAEAAKGLLRSVSRWPRRP